MTHALYGDDPEPAEQVPAGRLCVPVRPVTHGCAARLFRTPLGGRTAVAFTTPGGLRAVLGPDQSWIALAEPAVWALVRPLGVEALTVDPTLMATPSDVESPAPAPAVPGTAVPGSAAPVAAPATARSRPRRPALASASALVR